jgi:hypothetical protein
MDELGAIQTRLGKPDDAKETYNRMRSYAQLHTNLQSQLIAAENSFHLAANA